MEDLIKPHFPDMTESKATFLSKGLGQTSLLVLVVLFVLCCVDLCLGQLPGDLTIVTVPQLWSTAWCV